MTGAGGFAGSHLLRLLANHTDWQLFGCYRTQVDLRPQDRVVPIVADLTERAQADEAVRRSQPEVVFHLAAMSSPHLSFSQPLTVITNNVSAQLNLLEAIRQYRPEAKVLIVGSGDEYGTVKPEELPVREDTPLRPTSPYSVSKVCQDFLALQYHLAYGLYILRLRPFNHIGPGQEDAFVVASFSRQIAEIEAGIRQPVIMVGNLQTKRDFTDVRDIARAYYLAIGRCQPGEVYNVGSGVAHSIAQVLSTLQELSGLKVTIRTDPSRLRPADVPAVVADCTKFRMATGWEPSISFEQSLRDTLDYWRERVRREVRG